MLHENTVAPATLGLLRELMREDLLQQFALVGGTNLSLRLGHRISDDIDLFANEPYENDRVADLLRTLFSEEITIVEKRVHTILAYIRSIKVDIVLHRYPYLQPVETIDGIRFASVPDIAAMKLNAITRRSTQKDFFDIAELLDQYTVGEMLSFFSKKYAATDIGFVVRSLVYFEEAELSKDPVMIKPVEWRQVKEKIEWAVRVYWQGL